MNSISKNININNYLSLINSNQAYIKYLESFGEDNILNRECDINNLKVGYAAFTLLLWKDEYIKKNVKKELSTTLIDELLDEYVKKIANKDENGKWKIDSIEFNDTLEVIDKVRNKLAHGDYYIEDNNIIININNSEGKINISNLVGMTTGLAYSWEYIQATGENTIGLIRNNNSLDNVVIKTPKDLDYALSNCSYIEIKDKPKELKIRDADYVQMINNLKQTVMREIRRQHPVETIVENRHIKAILDNVGINATIKETKVDELESINKIRNMYLSKLELLKDIAPYFQQKYLGYWIHEAEKKGMNKKSICFGLMNNEYYLNILGRDSTRSQIEIVENDIAGDVLSILNEKTLISAYITSFYFTYVYGLDNILNKNNQEHIIDIVENKVFDYSKLDLSKIIPNSLVIENDYSCFKDQTKKLERDIEKLRERHSKIEENVVRLSNVNKNSSTLNELKLLQNNLIQEITEKEKLLEKCEYFLLNNYNDYVRNRSIIEHIRNSIAHGNIKLDIFQGNYTVNDTLMQLEDIYNGESTFKIKIKVEDFNTLFNDYNLNKIYELIGESKENKLNQK